MFHAAEVAEAFPHRFEAFVDFDIFLRRQQCVQQRSLRCRKSQTVFGGRAQTRNQADLFQPFLGENAERPVVQTHGRITAFESSQELWK